MKRRRTVPRYVGKASVQIGRLALVSFCFVLLVYLAACGRLTQEGEKALKTMAPGDYSFVIEIGGSERFYIVHVPLSYNGKTAIPVGIMLHGGGGTAKGMMAYTGWSQKADEEGFLAVYPEATRQDPSKPASWQNPPIWNDGSARYEAGEKDVPDAAYMGAILDDLTGRFAIDPNRIYVAGMSNGGSMAFRIGVEFSDHVAAIAVVAGALWVEPILLNPVSLCYITGTDDPLNPMEGGMPKMAGTAVGGREKPPVEVNVIKWAKALGCSPEPKVIYDRDGVKGVSYAPCSKDSEAVLYTIEGMGHHWPGGIGVYLPEQYIGKKVDTVTANDIIWDFFAGHPRR